MKNFHYFLASIILFLFASCKEEGLGGSSSITGYVYNIVYQSDDYSINPDTIPAAGERIYIIYSDNENDPVAEKDVRTNHLGMYHFQYLRKGNYIVYALSSYPRELNNRDEAEMQHVKLGSGTARPDAIYIRSGNGFGVSMIKGKVLVQYYDRENRPLGEPVPAVGHRVFLKRKGDETHFDDVRVGDQGTFIFTRVTPGIMYEVYTTTEGRGVRNKDLLFPISEIEVSEEHITYELPEVEIILNL